jgi:hypothetical protein
MWQVKRTKKPITVIDGQAIEVLVLSLFSIFSCKEKILDCLGRQK